MDFKEIRIMTINEGIKKSKIVQEVLFDLPEWFGLEDSTKEYIEQSKELPLLVALLNDKVLGLVTLKETSPEVCEIHCMGVKKEYHRQGIGIKLHQALEELAKKDYLYMQVKTVDEGYYKQYDQTIAFYQSVGFTKMEVFPTLWDKWNPCLVMIKAL